MDSTLPPAHWAADPSGRHQYRYWDGARWTDHVADQGAQAVDPLDPDTADIGDGMLTPATVVPPPPPPALGTGLAGTGMRWAPSAWRAIGGLRTALVALLATSGVSTLATIAVLSQRVAAINALGDHVTFARWQNLRDADDAVTAATAVELVVLVATATVWIIWQWRAAKNVETLGRVGARFGPGWSIGAWFIPFANFVIPVRIMQGFWRATEPGTQTGSRWTDGKGSALVGWWWGLFLAGNLIGRAVNPDEIKPRDIASGRLDADKFTTSDTTAIFGLCLSIVAVVLAIMVVIKLTRRFDERRAESHDIIDV